MCGVRLLNILMDENIKEDILEEPEVKKIKIEEITSADVGKVGDITADIPNGLSKRQLKKLKRRELWLANLPEKRAREKNRLKMRKKEARENNLKLGPTRKELKNSKMCRSACKVRLVLDFSFDKYMSSRDIGKCVNQLLRCYSANRRCANPVQMYVVNFGGASRKEISKHNGYEHWDVNFNEQSYLEIFDRDSLIYLTSDSENVIQTVEDDKVYIIGALVDHNSQKGLCLNIAVQQGIKHGCLPIGEYFDMKTRKVLAVNHVFQIMAYVSNGMSWKDAFLKTLPQRKGATEKTSLE